MKKHDEIRVWLRYSRDIYLVKMLAAPLGGVFPRMTIEHCEESLSSDTGEIDDERVRVFHVPARALVLGHADLECSVPDRVLVEDLRDRGCGYLALLGDLQKHTPNVSRPSAVVMDFERAFGESEKRGVAMEVVVDGEEAGNSDRDRLHSLSVTCTATSAVDFGVSGISDWSTFSSSLCLIVRLFRYPRKLWMSQQSAANAKPSLQGVKIKARKGAVKAHAKHEPSGKRPICAHHVSTLISISTPSFQRPTL